MKLENHEWQLSNLELSKRIKELGVKQESLWWWQNLNSWQVVDKFKANDVFMRNTERGIIIETISAFTIAELYQIHWEMFGKFPSVIGLKPKNIADYLAKEIIHETV